MTVAADFDPRRVLATTPVDPSCTYTRNSVHDVGWSSVLYRVGQRNDASGRADMGVAEHPRLTLTRRGGVWFRRANATRHSSGRLAPGSSWLVPPGEQLGYEWTGAGTAMREIDILVLPRRQLDAAAEALADRPRTTPVRWEGVSLADDGVIGAVMTGIRRALAAGADDLYAKTASAFLLQHLLVTYAGAAAPPRVGREDARIRAVLDYLADNLHRTTTLADMAAVAGLSTYYFVRVFREATGDTPRRHLLRLRLDAARRRLADPDLSITEIASMCGFASASHLSTAFRRATGVSPRTYRDQLRRG